MDVSVTMAGGGVLPPSSIHRRRLVASHGSVLSLIGDDDDSDDDVWLFLMLLCGIHDVKDSSSSPSMKRKPVRRLRLVNIRRENRPTMTATTRASAEVFI